MTTAQDQQSRAEFEAHMRKLSPCVRLYRHTCDGGDKYRTVTVQRNWELWQAARALPTGMEPLCYLRPAAATTPARAWQAWENDGTAQPVYTAAQVQAMGRVPPGWQAVPVEPTAEQINAAHERGFFRQLAIPLCDAMLAEAPRPPIAQKRYRLLVRNVDTIQADDEFLRDADSNWQIDPQGIFVGMTYMSNVLLPARRAIEPAP